MKRAKHKKEASAKLSYVWLPYGNLRVNQSVLPWTRVRIPEWGLAYGLRLVLPDQAKRNLGPEIGACF